MALAQIDETGPVFDSAVAILKVLPEDSQRKVLDFSVGLLQRENDNPFRPKSEDELFEKIDHSIKQADSGMLMDADDALDEVMEELGL
jgi:hypothetical protein